jgi:adenosylhomocysteine nucleosidase
VTRNKIGLIGAMVEEIRLMEEKLERETVTVKAGIRFMEGTLNGKPVVLCKSGVGKVNAAVCTQILIDRFGADAVIFTGVAGALDPSLDIGDVVVSTECVQHDMDASPLGFPRGTIPFADMSVFPADPELVRLAYEASRALPGGRALKGRVLSGDQFVADRETVRRLHEELQGVCVEMEGAAVAQVCAMNGVPYVVIRSMSDKADGSAHVNFAEFAVQVADNSCQIVNRMLLDM